MDLQHFIPHVLAQINNGIRAARKDMGDDIPLDLILVNSKDLGFERQAVAGGFRYVQVVEFDVALTVREEAGGGVSLNVLGLGLGGDMKGASSKEADTRVKFKVALALPDVTD